MTVASPVRVLSSDEALSYTKCDVVGVTGYGSSYLVLKPVSEPWSKGIHSTHKHWHGDGRGSMDLGSIDLRLIGSYRRLYAEYSNYLQTTTPRGLINHFG